MNEWRQEKAVMEGVGGSLANAMILKQLAGQCRRRGERVPLGFVSTGHLLLVSQSARRCSQMNTELWADRSPREVCRALQPRGRWNCWDGFQDGWAAHKEWEESYLLTGTWELRWVEDKYLRRD